MAAGPRSERVAAQASPLAREPESVPESVPELVRELVPELVGLVGLVLGLVPELVQASVQASVPELVPSVQGRSQVLESAPVAPEALAQALALVEQEV